MSQPPEDDDGPTVAGMEQGGGLGGTGARLGDAIDAIQELFFVFSFAGEMLTWNERVRAVTGYTDAEIADVDPMTFIAPEDRDAVAEAIRQVAIEGETVTEARLYTADGERIPYVFRGALLTDDGGEPAAVCGTGQDVSGRKRREAELRQQAERLETLNHVNAVIRDVNEALVRTDSRAEIESTVTEHLVDADPYRLAWVGDLTVTGDRVEPRAVAGEGAGYLDERPAGVDAGVTAEDAVRTGETRVVQSIADAPESAPWRAAARAHGLASAAAIPLSYRDSDYGVLCVYAERPGAFDETERSVLTELGETIGYAIAAAEQRRALVSDTLVEVELGFDPPGPFFVRLARESGVDLALEGAVEETDGSVAVFYAADDDPAGLVPVAEELGGEVSVVTRYDDGGVVRLHPDAPPVAALVAHHGGVLRDAAADAEGGRARIELPAGADVRTVVEAIDRAYPGTELLAQRERERAGDRGMEFRDTLDAALTDRQEEVLETAYHAGFFGWPRDSSAEAVADLLDVAPSTFHEHRRRAVAKLLEAYFASGDPT